MVTDPIADLLIRLKNGSQRRHEAITVPASKLKRSILQILKNEGYVEAVEDGTQEGHPVLKVQLRYVEEGQPMITGLQRISKPGRRVYVGSKEIERVRSPCTTSLTTRPTAPQVPGR